MYNVILTIMPYIAGFCSKYSIKMEMDGILIFYICGLIVRFILSLYMGFVNRFRFDNKLNTI